MRLMDIYENVENPFNDESLKKILKVFSEKDTLYDGLITCSDKKYTMNKFGFCRSKFNEKDRDKFYTKLTNIWKNSLKDNLEYGIYNGVENPEFSEFLEQMKPYFDKEFTNYDEALSFLCGGCTEDSKMQHNLHKFKWNINNVYWEHVFSKNVLGRYYEYYPIEHRLYINPDSCDLFEFMNYFIDKCHSKGQEYYFKFDKSIERDDIFVLYCNTNNLERHLNILKEIEHEHPELISRFHNPPLLTGKINNWIGYGAEPNYAYNKTGQRYSYTSLREENIIVPAIYETTDKWIKENLNREIEVKGKKRTFRELFCHMAVNGIVKDIHEEIDSKSTEEALNTVGITKSDIENPQVLFNIYNLANSQIEDNLNDFFTRKKDVVKLQMEFRGKYYQFNMNNVFRDLPRRIAVADSNYFESLKESIAKKSIEYGVEPEKFFIDKVAKEQFKEHDLFYDQIDSMFKNKINENQNNTTYNQAKK